MKPRRVSPRPRKAHSLPRDLLGRLQESLEFWTRRRKTIVSALSFLKVGAILENGGPRWTERRSQPSEPVILTRALCAEKKVSIYGDQRQPLQRLEVVSVFQKQIIPITKLVRCQETPGRTRRRVGRGHGGLLLRPCPTPTALRLTVNLTLSPHDSPSSPRAPGPFLWKAGC